MFGRVTTVLLVPATDAATRREFLAMMAAAGLLAACGSDDDGAAPPAADTRTVQDVFGSVDVPVAPLRVIAMEQQVLGNLVALGFPIDQIVGFARSGTDLAAYDFIADVPTLAAIEDVGDFAEPNAEAIVRLAPDLILLVGEQGYDDFYGPIFDRLDAVGVPVYTAFNGYVTLRDSMKLLADVGRAVGLEDEAAALEADLRASVTDLRDRVEAIGPMPTAAFLRVTPEGVLYNTLMPLLDELGVPGPRPAPEQFFEELSAEQLGQFQHDVLFVSDGDDPDGTLATLRANPLWGMLPAVRTERVHLVADTLWGASYSVPAFRAQLADIESALLP
jgi:iron complex transport system substrate-binding protein